MATLKTICQRALRRVPSFAVPTSFVTNTDDDVAQRAYECAQDTGEELSRDYDWQRLIVKDYTFATVDGTSDYDLPSGFKRAVDQTFWDRTNDWPLRGPATGMEYQTLQSGVVAAGIRHWFRVAGNKIVVIPTPSAANTLVFDYWSNLWCESSGGTPQSEWAADTDVARLPAHLFILGTRYYFKRSQGLPYEDDETDYYNAISSAQYDDAPRQSINMTGTRLTGDHPGLPESGYGA